MADTLYLVHVIPSLSPRRSTDEEVLSQVADSLMDKLAKEAYEVCMVKTVPRILEGIDIGKAICTEAERIQPAAVVMGSRGLGFVKSFIQGSVSDYCARHCPCPVIIMPHRGKIYFLH
jgi:nucleotide-binding universal stress UspA family protein